MILPDLYKILSFRNTDSAEYEFIVEINPEDLLFNGHFPQRPILPGVCTIEVVKECICSVIGKPLHFMNISQCKFIGMVDPFLDNRLTVLVALRVEGESEYNVSASVTNAQRSVFKIKATMTEVGYVK